MNVIFHPEKVFPLLATGLAIASLAPAAGADAFAAAAPFIEQHCADCHDAETKKGGLDLTSLGTDLGRREWFESWVKVHDLVSAGEMPPRKKARPPEAERAAFTTALAESLTAADRTRVAREGRATQRRLNRYEYENTLRDLLSLPHLRVKDFLPEDGESHHFNKVGGALDVSHVQMARYLSAADFALRAAMASQPARPEARTVRYYAREQADFSRSIKLFPRIRRPFPVLGVQSQPDVLKGAAPWTVGASDPARRELEAVGVVVSTGQATEIRFTQFLAPVAGFYRLRFHAYPIWVNYVSDPAGKAPDFNRIDFTKISAGRRPEPVTISADARPNLRKLGSFDVTSEAPTGNELVAWLEAGETIRPDAARLFRAVPPEFHNPLKEPDGMPGVAFRWMEVEGPLVGEWPPPGHRLLFGDLPLAELAKGKSSSPVEVVSKTPDLDAKSLLRGFMKRAYRRPVAEAEERRFLTIIQQALKAGDNFTEAMLAGYTAVLCSPGFLYLEEKPGRLDDHALAARLAYFLWNGPPDDELRALAGRGALRRPEVLRAQTTRLLDDPKSRRFVDAFLDYWLDLRKIAATAPDATLYPDYQLDDLLVESVIEETQLFFAELLRGNLPAENLVAADFAMLNERLARHYGLPPVAGVALRRVALPPDSVRGGLMTQASVLKVTANGTTTSPVLRGVWILERILGQPVPPPPEAVAAVEPDTRGATTIREQLDKHRVESCAGCHRKIDPPGFALESFDPLGGWRAHYRSLGEGEPVKGVGHDGQSFKFKLGPVVDASGELSDGRKFQDVRELKRALLQDPDQLARNLVHQLTVYATGAPVQFADRPAVAGLLARTKAGGHGVRALVHEIVQSELFQTK